MGEHSLIYSVILPGERFALISDFHVIQLNESIPFTLDLWRLESSLVIVINGNIPGNMVTYICLDRKDLLFVFTPYSGFNMFLSMLCCTHLFCKYLHVLDIYFLLTNFHLLFEYYYIPESFAIFLLSSV